jgi:hypothetical protein
MSLQPGIPSSIRLPVDLRRVLRKQARKEHRSVSGLMVFILDSHAKAAGWFEAHRAPGKPAKIQKLEAEKEERDD